MTSALRSVLGLDTFTQGSSGGGASRRNLMTFPSLGPGPGTWGFNAGVTRSTTLPGDMIRQTGLAMPSNSYALSPDIAITGGETYTISAEWRHAVNAGAEMSLEWYSSSGNFLSAVKVTPVVAPNLPTRIYATGTAPATAVRCNLVTSTFTSGAAASVTGFMIETGVDQNPYLDGDVLNGVWDGVAGESTSSLVASVPNPPTMPTVDAGPDQSGQVGTAVVAVATEIDNGAEVYDRAWTIVTGPTGAGSTISTGAALSWAPSTAGSYRLRYSATNVYGTGTDDVDVVVAALAPPGSHFHVLAAS